MVFFVLFSVTITFYQTGLRGPGLIADDDYVSSGGDNEIDEIFQVFDISDEAGEDYQIYTEKILDKNENPHIIFISKKKLEI